MEFKKPKVFILGSTIMQYEGCRGYLDHIGASTMPLYENDVSDEERLTEIYSRSCYKSFAIGLNPNITKVRGRNKEHLENVVRSGHGSVLEHCMINFMFCDVSRVLTHELVRHRVGIAISQESLRYVRLEELKCFDFPRLEELTEDEEEWFRQKTQEVFHYLENVQKQMTDRFKLNEEESFSVKKKLTSRMRRLAPLGLLTNIGWSANLRALRHIIPLRTHKSAEEEIRYVFGDVGHLMKDRYPNIFFDMEWISDGDSTGLGEWRIDNKKV